MGLDTMVAKLHAAHGASVPMEGWVSTCVGGGARTIELSPDGRWLCAAFNSRASLVVVDTTTMHKVAEVRTESSTVGLGISPDGTSVWTTSQGRGGTGGNAVCVDDINVKTE